METQLSDQQRAAFDAIHHSMLVCYLTFQTLYGLRIYWLCGAALCLAGLALGLARAPARVSALSGAAVEFVFAAIIFAQAKRNAA